MKLTPLAKAFIAVVVFGVIGFATWHYKGAAIKEWAGGERAEGGDSKGDFDKLNGAPGDPGRNVGSTGVSATSVGTGKLSRPLVVGINTWAGHAPGIVFNNGMDPNPGSSYKRTYGMDVKFVLLEDPAAKLAAFRTGQVDIMWNTVDNWAREASILAEQNQSAKSIIMHDWSRGGDGLVSLTSIKSVEDLKGQDRLRFTPSHFLLPIFLPHRLSPENRAQRENIIHNGRTRRRRFKAKQIDPVGVELDLSGAIRAAPKHTCSSLLRPPPTSSPTRFAPGRM